MTDQLEELKNNLARKAFGKTRDEAHSNVTCICCGEPALPKCYSDAGKREYHISGMCEECFDNLFKED